MASDTDGAPPNEQDQKLVRQFMEEIVEDRFGGKLRECARKTGIHHSTLSRWSRHGAESVHHLKGPTWRKVRKALGKEVPEAD